MLPARLVLRLPAHVLNGIGVAIGVGLVQGGVGALFGHALALAATGGAVYASLPDVPQPPARTWRRTLTGALLGGVVTLLVSAARPQPALLGLVIAVIGFATALALAWGPRAGPLGFSAVLAIVFTLAAPAAGGLHLRSVGLVLGLVTLGGGVYTAWAWCWSSWMQRRYRRLALAGVLTSLGRLMQARVATLIETGPLADDALRGLTGWLTHETALAEQLQAARNLLHAVAPDVALQAKGAVLVEAIDLHEMLQTSELDLDLLGHDAPAQALREQLAVRSRHIAESLLALEAALRLQRWPVPPPVLSSASSSASPSDLEPAPLFAAGDPRARVAAVLLRRADDLDASLDRICTAVRAVNQPGDGAAAAAGPPAALNRPSLRHFVSADDWPLAALTPHWQLGSPVLRHALRVALAMGSAYFLAVSLPWAAHPYWLVLSVAVMLRGNLEQTLARRNARLFGTVAGCFVALALAQTGLHWLLSLAFLVAAALAHAYVTQRYIVTTMAGTVMALVQSYLAHPASGLAVGERLADTVLGVALAWAFCYVLPSWERRGARRLALRVGDSLARLAAHTLRWPTDEASDVALRLARREAFDTLTSVALAARRTRFEPRAVRLPLVALTDVLVHGQALLAHLLAVRVLLALRRDELPRSQAEPALQAAATDVRSALDPAQGCSVVPPEAVALPLQSPGEALLPWLQRRLWLCSVEAGRLAQAVAALQELAPARRPPAPPQI